MLKSDINIARIALLTVTGNVVCRMIWVFQE